MVRETRHLWVGNLPPDVREDRIRDHFKRYGRVQSVKVQRGGGGGGSDSLSATVSFMDIKSAAKAHHSDQKLDDRILTTEYHEPPSIHHYRTHYSHSGSEESFERHFYEREYHSSSGGGGGAGAGGGGVGGGVGVVGGGGGTGRAGAGRYDLVLVSTAGSGPGPVVRRASSGTAPPPPRSSYRPPPPPSPLVPSPQASPAAHQQPNTDRVRGWSGYEVSHSPSRYHQESSYQVEDRLQSKSSQPPSLNKSVTSMVSGGLSELGGGGSSSVSTRSRSSSTSSHSSESSHDDDSSSNKSSVCPRVSPQQQGSVVDGDRRQPLAICVRNLPSRSSDTSLKDGLYHEYKKHGKVTWVKVVGSGSDRYAIVCFKRPDDVDKALQVSHDKLFFGCKIDVAPYHPPTDVDIDNDFRPFEADQDEFHPKATRTLFIGNLDKDITAQEIRKHFDQFGEILDIDVKKQGTSASYAFCQYADIASVVRAIRSLDGEHVANTRVKLGFGKSLHTNCVWVDGISESVSDKYLSQHFSQFGPVVNLEIDRNRGQALIFYEQIGFAQAAVKEMRGVLLRGRKLQVDYASRECQDAFYEHMAKGSSTAGSGNLSESVVTRGYETPSSSGSSGSSSSGGGSSSRYPRCYSSSSSGSRYQQQAPSSRQQTKATSQSSRPQHHYDSNSYNSINDYLSESRRSSYRSYEIDGDDSSVKDKEIEDCLVGEETRRKCKHRHSGNSNNNSNSNGGSGATSNNRGDNEGSSRPGTPLYDERPEPTEPRRPRSRPQDPLSLPLPRFATQVLPPPSPPSSDDSQPSPPSPEWEERLRSLDEKYQKWNGSRTAAKPDPSSLRTRPRFLDPHELQPSEIVKSLLAKRSVFDEDLKRLENFNDKYEPKEFIPGRILRSPPVTKGLQYPFPSHPVWQTHKVSTTTTTTTTTTTVTATATTPVTPPPSKVKPKVEKTEIKKEITSSLLVSSIKPAAKLVGLRRDSEPSTVERRKSRDELHEVKEDLTLSEDIKNRRNSTDESVERRLSNMEDQQAADSKEESKEIIMLPDPRLHNDQQDPPPPSNSQHIDRKKDIFGVNSEKDRRRKESICDVSAVAVDNLKIKKVPENKCDVIALKGNSDETKSSECDNKKEETKKDKPSRRDSLEGRDEVRIKDVKLNKCESSTDERKEINESKEYSLFKKVFGFSENIRTKENKIRESGGEKANNFVPSESPKDKKETDEKKKDEVKSKTFEEGRHHDKKKHSGENKKKENHLEEFPPKDYELNYHKRKVIEKCLTSNKDQSGDAADGSKSVKELSDKKRDSNFVETESLKSHKDVEKDVNAKKNKEIDKKNDLVDSGFDSDGRRNRDVEKSEKNSKFEDHNKVKHVVDKYKDFDKKKHHDSENKLKDEKRREDRKDHDHEKNRKKDGEFDSRNTEDIQKLKREFDFDAMRRLTEDRCKKEHFENNRFREGEENKKNRKKDSCENVDLRLPKSDLSGAERKKELMEKERRRDRELVDGTKYGGDDARKTNKVNESSLCVKVNGDHTFEDNDEGERKKRSDRVNSWPAASVGFKRRLSSQDSNQENNPEELNKKTKQERRDSKDSTKSSTSSSTTPRRHENHNQFQDEKHRKSSAKKERKAAEKKRDEKKIKNSSSRLKENGTASESDFGSGDDEVKNLKRQHSIFDIVDDEPAYISMYDKVKARSTKNMQKQEEEKRQEKLKEKFSQLKQCRAKREEKKRSTSYDEDSDSERGGINRRCNKHLITSSEEENMSENDKNRKISVTTCYDTSEDERRQVKRDIIVDEEVTKARKILSDTSEDDVRHHQGINAKQPLVNSTVCNTEVSHRSQHSDNKLLRKIASDTSEDDTSRRRKVKAMFVIQSDEESDDLHVPSRETSKVKVPNAKKADENVFHSNSYSENRADSESDNPRQSSSPDNNFCNNTLDNSISEIYRKKKKQKKQKHFDNEEGIIIKKHSKKDKKKSHLKEEDENGKKLKKKKERESKREDKMEDIFGPLSDDSDRNLMWRINQIFASDSDSEHERKKEKRRREKKARELDEAGRALQANLLSGEPPLLVKNKKKKRKKSREEKVNKIHDGRFEESKRTDEEEEVNKNFNMFIGKVEKEEIRLSDSSHRSSIEEEPRSKSKQNDNTMPELVELVALPSPQSFNDKHSFDELRRYRLENEKNRFKDAQDDDKQMVLMNEIPPPLLKTEKKCFFEKSKQGDEELRVKQHRMEEEAVESILPHSALVSGLQVEPTSPGIPVTPPKPDILLDHQEQGPLLLNKVSPSLDKSTEEKQAAVISQEETEDAVAALLKEDAFVSADPAFDNEDGTNATGSFAEEDEEGKPATPASEPDLRIDTDTEDESNIDMSKPPRTPDIPQSYYLEQKTVTDSTPPVVTSADQAPVLSPLLETPETPGKDDLRLLEIPRTPGSSLDLKKPFCDEPLSPPRPVKLNLDGDEKNTTIPILEEIKHEPVSLLLEEIKAEEKPFDKPIQVPQENEEIVEIKKEQIKTETSEPTVTLPTKNDDENIDAIPKIEVTPPPPPPPIFSEETEILVNEEKSSITNIPVGNGANVISNPSPLTGGVAAGTTSGVLVGLAPKQGPLMQPTEDPVMRHALPPLPHQSLPTAPASVQPHMPFCVSPQIKGDEISEKSKKIDMVVRGLQQRALAFESKESSEKDYLAPKEETASITADTEIKKELLEEVQVKGIEKLEEPSGTKNSEPEEALPIKKELSPPPSPVPSEKEDVLAPVTTPVKEVKTRKSRRCTNGRFKRGGRMGNNVANHAAISTNSIQQQPTPSTGTQAPSASSDVYEFKDDSEEERPRLILTIKSPPAAATTVASTTVTTHEKSVNSLTAANNTTSISASVVASSTPQTRKSRRLQEKDGKSTVEETIEEVVRWKRRATRSGGPTQEVPQVLTSTPRKSPRRKGAAAAAPNPPSAPATTAPAIIASPTAASSTAVITSTTQTTSTITPSVSVPVVTTSIVGSTPPVVTTAPATTIVTVAPVTSSVAIVTSVTTVVTSTVGSPVISSSPAAGANVSVPTGTAGSATQPPTTLIDPVTGLLMPMQEAEEGQYVPLHQFNRSDGEPAEKRLKTEQPSVRPSVVKQISPPTAISPSPVVLTPASVPSAKVPEKPVNLPTTVPIAVSVPIINTSSCAAKPPVVIDEGIVKAVVSAPTSGLQPPIQSTTATSAQPLQPLAAQALTKPLILPPTTTITPVSAAHPNPSSQLLMPPLQPVLTSSTHPAVTILEHHQSSLSPPMTLSSVGALSPTCSKVISSPPGIRQQSSYKSPPANKVEILSSPSPSIVSVSVTPATPPAILAAMRRQHPPQQLPAPPAVSPKAHILARQLHQVGGVAGSPPPVPGHVISPGAPAQHTAVVHGSSSVVSAHLASSLHHHQLHHPGLHSVTGSPSAATHIAAALGHVPPPPPSHHLAAPVTPSTASVVHMSTLAAAHHRATPSPHPGSTTASLVPPAAHCSASVTRTPPIAHRTPPPSHVASHTPPPAHITQTPPPSVGVVAHSSVVTHGALPSAAVHPPSVVTHTPHPASIPSRVAKEGGCIVSPSSLPQPHPEAHPPSAPLHSAGGWNAANTPPPAHQHNSTKSAGGSVDTVQHYVGGHLTGSTSQYIQHSQLVNSAYHHHPQQQQQPQTSYGALSVGAVGRPSSSLVPGPSRNVVVKDEESSGPLELRQHRGNPSANTVARYYTPPAAHSRSSDSLMTLLQRYPVLWQGLLALKQDQAAVQMHFVYGNPVIARHSLPCNSDGSTPPLRIVQRMRLEPQQIDGVSRKMQMDMEHCMLLALPCGRDYMDVLQQSNNLQSCFITYLQQKQAAGIVNIAIPPSQQASYVVHIFPSCEFANEALERIAPDLLTRVANVAHLLIVIGTV